MASIALSSMALGSVITLNENGVAAEFVIARHDYESGLNGAGRTLLVRKTSLADKYRWGYVDSTTDLRWDDRSDLKTWLEQTYAARLDEEIRRNIGKTKYYFNVPAYTHVSEQTEGSVFLLSAAELSSDKQYRDGSTKLDDAVLRVLESGEGDPWWTRSVYPNSHKEDGDDMEYWWFTRVALYKKYRKHSWSENKDIEGWAIEESGFPDAEYDGTATIRPCLTVPGTMRVDDGTGGGGGSLRENHPPKISCWLPDQENMGSYSRRFDILYTVYDEDANVMTVTEYVDGIQLKQFTAQNGQQILYTLDERVFGQLAAEKYHTVKITVYDGTKAAEWTQTFYKSYQKGYRVYAGTLAGKRDGIVNNGAHGLNSYKWDTRYCIYDPTCVDDERDNIIIDPQLEMEKNEFGSFEFTMPVSSCFYNSLIPRRTVVSVEEDGVEIWMGYVTEINKNFQMEKKVYCEGELGFLQDISLVLEAQEYTAYALFVAIMEAAIAASVSGWKLFLQGKISENFKNVKIDLRKYGTQYTTVWEALNSLLLGNVGGILRIRKLPNELDGHYDRYLDYFWSENELGCTSQSIEFGKNLLDLDYYVKAYDIVNRVTYYGYETKGWWIFAHTNKISVTVEDSESVVIYGSIERCYVADGTASTKESLMKAAKEKLDELKLKMDYSFEISALDLRDAGVDVDRLGFMKRAQILSWPHGLNQLALCTKLSIPLEKLDEKKFTFGGASETLSSQQATGTGAAKRAAETLRSVVSYINR